MRAITFRHRFPRFVFLVAGFLLLPATTGSSLAESLDEALRRPILAPKDSLSEVQRYCEKHVVRMPDIRSREQWAGEAERIRRDVLDKVVFRGEAAEWRAAKTRVERLEVIEGGAGYRIRKLRYEALPGLWIPALLYEPTDLSGRVPAVMNVNGHDGNGKAADYKQIRCINQAKRGMLALNVEWLGMGQLRHENFRHYRMNQLDLCGTSGLSVFYLAMQRGLDVLLSHEHADPERVAVAGLSGGGWQTIFISSLDTRVTLANPVAGYSSYLTRVHHQSDLGDSEQTPVDLATVADYTHLTALLAPRATLLTYNEKDNCCFAAPHALQPLLDAAGPAFGIFDRGDHLRHHVNYDPGTHNFERDNREALYRMLRDHFASGDARFSAEEIECKDELKTSDQLEVELPAGNLDFHQLALRLMQPLPRHAELPSEREEALRWQALGRERLRQIVRWQDAAVRAEQVDQSSAEDCRITRWKLHVGDTWTVPAVELEPQQPAGTSLLLADQGRSALEERAKELLGKRRRVLLIDPFYFGESKIQGRDFLYALLVSAVGGRPLGIQAGQVASVAHWLRARYPGEPVSLETSGPRTSLIGLVAAAADAQSLEEVRLVGSHGSLKEVIEANSAVDQTPELFCFGLLEQVDIKQLVALTAPRPVLLAAPSERARRELAGLQSWYETLGKPFDPLQD